MSSLPAICPLGDQAVIVRLADERSAVELASAARSANWDWLLDVVPAYSSVGIYFDADRTGLANVEQAIRALDNRSAGKESTPRSHLIPCCYEFELDLAGVSRHVGLTADAVIGLHVDSPYQVHAIGFAPGFPYLGYLPEAFSRVPRLPAPRLRVEAGSVGIAARQTGVYPQVRPAGWNIIGRTPLSLVDIEDGYFPLRVGDTVRFSRIDEYEFGRLVGERLPVATYCPTSYL